MVAHEAALLEPSYHVDENGPCCDCCCTWPCQRTQDSQAGWSASESSRRGAAVSNARE